MSIRTIEYTIDSGGRVTPSAPLYGGVQGEHNATSVTFNISAIAKSGAYYRVEWIDGAGEFGSSEHLEAQSGVITYPLSGEVTSGGVKITLTLIQAVMNENNVEQVLFAVPVLIFLTAAGVDENTVANYKRGLSGLALTAAQQASEAESSAQQAAEASAKAIEAEENIKNTVSIHNTDTEAHEDIRDEVKKLGNSIANSIYAHNVDDTSHSDIRKNLVNHNTDTTAHPDIRDDINTLGSIHVPQAIKSHNTDTTAHADIRDDINNLGNTVIPNTVKSAVNAHNTDTSNTHLDIRDAIQNMGDTVVPNIVKTAVEEHDMDTTAHADIREQRNDDMNNLSANIIPAIANAKVSLHNTDTEAHTDIREQLELIENGGVPDYWLSHLEERADTIRQIMETAGRNKSAFLWYTDAHWNNNSQMSPTLLKYLYEHTPINKVIFGGDIVNNEPTAETIDDRTIMAYLWEWRHAIRGLNHHSVIGNHDDGNTTNNIFPENYIYAYLNICALILRRLMAHLSLPSTSLLNK